ncbi:ABC transporter permease subunit [Pseudarthrobacter psychrotolerans]|uniref:ABC transporter permease subunit n=1 Tax=Pseudarthrobacter psychrotolerans TaxID=2697569 RepID=A0A6P1NIY9_9MICC|nr:sugar ABC transporter permease [Pseudarthrobacter psychrotolerans]QHK20595.1 ABC transporter permease subunit [Pseudarthrobacter psychrotolerans]
MALPASLHAGIWIGLPMLASIVLSFTQYDVISAPRFIGLANFEDLFTDPVFMTSLKNTAVYAFFTVPVSMAIALVLAVMLNQGIRGQMLYRTAIFIPQVTATVAIALVWLWIYNPRGGLANQLLGFFGIGQVSWLTDTAWSLPSIIAVGVWQGIGLKMLIYLAALQGLPKDVFEAASIDGATAVQKFMQITVPMLKPATFFVLVTSIIGAFQAFDQVYILTQGGPANSTTLITYEIYKSAFQQFRMGLACAQSLVLFIFLIVLTLINRRLMGGSNDDS